MEYSPLVRDKGSSPCSYPLYVKNWLNTEYKLIAKCLAYRALKYMGELINLDQTGFLPGRYIGENTSKIICIIQQAEINGVPGILIATSYSNFT